MKKYGQEKNLISRTEIDAPKTNIHVHEIQTYNFTALIKNPNGEVFLVQNLKRDTHFYKVIYNGLCTIVILDDGSKGIAKCNPKDRYIRQIGHDIAHCRAKIKSLDKEIKMLMREGGGDVKHEKL